MNVLDPQFNTLPEPVRQFCLAIIENAKQVWDDFDFLSDLLHIEVREGGEIEVSDNFERFFSTIYTYRPESNQWFVRNMYSDCPTKAYTFAGCMSDASMMYTG